MDTKVCSVCKEPKLISLFNNCTSRKDGKQRTCRECQAKYRSCPEATERALAANRKWSSAHPDAVRARNMKDSNKKLRAEWKQKHFYGITLADKERLLDAQGGVCAICGSSESGGNGWHTDHDHETGIVRGVLCNNCNRGLGHLKDSPSVLLSAYHYLLRYKVNAEENKSGYCPPYSFFGTNGRADNGTKIQSTN